MPKICFLCGCEIKEKVSMEHIFSDAFLKKMNLKKMKFRYNATNNGKEYSRLKSPTHPKCNNEFGSRFESETLEMIESLNERSGELSKLHLNYQNSDIKDLKGRILKWLTKIYLGLLCWESGLPKHENTEFQSNLKQLLKDPALKTLQRCLTSEQCFYVPSSVYYFKIPSCFHIGFEFDFATGLPLGLIYVKINEHLFIACIADDRLVEEYFTNENYIFTQKVIDENTTVDPVAYLYAVSHIWAVRANLPVTPNIFYNDNYLLCLSRIGLRPSICEHSINTRAKEIFDAQVKKFRQVVA